VALHCTRDQKRPKHRISEFDSITYDEFVAQTLHSLETAKARVEGDQSEAKVMDEYRNLIHTARRHLQLELSIRPELALSLKADNWKLGEEDLNIGTMVHAHWKITSLQGASQTKGLFHSFPQRCIG
jgi:hypothetical protein